MGSLYYSLFYVLRYGWLVDHCRRFYRLAIPVIESCYREYEYHEACCPLFSHFSVIAG